MNGFIKNEIKLFLSKKNLIIYIILLVLLFGVFVNVYETIYNNRFEYDILWVEQVANPIDSAILRYESDIIIKEENLDLLEEELEDASEEDVASINERIDIITQERSKDVLERNKYINLKEHVDRLKFYYNNQRTFYNQLGERFQLIDEIIEEDFIGQDIKYSGYGLLSDIDWQKRVMTREFNSNIPRNIDYPIGNYPSGLQIAVNYLEGNYLLIPVFIFVFMILANYDIWSNEFESNEGKVLFTLPIKSSKIYFYRFFIRLLLTLSMIFSALFFIFIYATLKYDFGPNYNLLVIKDVFSSFILDNNIQNDVINNFEGISLGRYLIYLILFQGLFYVVLFGIINTISLVIKNNIGSLIINIILLYGLISSHKSLSILNPLGYYNGNVAFRGLAITPFEVFVKPLGYYFYIGFFVVAIIGIYNVGKFLLKSNMK